MPWPPLFPSAFCELTACSRQFAKERIREVLSELDVVNGLHGGLVRDRVKLL